MKDYAETVSIDLQLTPDNHDNIVTIYQHPGEFSSLAGNNKYQIIAVNSYLKELMCYARMNSLPEIPFPDFENTDSDTDKLRKTVDLEWKSDRKQLNVYTSINNGPWRIRGSVSLTRPYGYGFKQYNLLDLLTNTLAKGFGKNSALGVGIENVGYGLLEPEDILTIEGTYSNEYLYEEAPLEPISKTVDYNWEVTETSKILLPTNEQRKQFTLVNVGNNPVYLSFGKLAVKKKGITLESKGSSYEFNLNNYPYFKEVSAVCDTGLESLLTGVEAW